MVVFMFHLMLPFMSLVKLEEIEKKIKKNLFEKGALSQKIFFEAIFFAF